jgi:site-specific recombinase XerD
MYDYFGFLQAHNLQWDDVQRGDNHDLISAYRDYSFDTGQLASNTVKQRLLYICEFYQYALKQNWIDTLPFEHEERSFHRGVLRPELIPTRDPKLSEVEYGLASHSIFGSAHA